MALFRSLDDIFPYGTESKEIRFTRNQLQRFELATIGDHVLCTPAHARSGNAP
ncbi:MAG: hypothetical protein R2743_10080 [Ilumatobacteraceae bacterium]